MSPERRKLYPKGWNTISRNFRESKNFTCEHCLVKQGEIRTSRRGLSYKVTVVAAHENHADRLNPNAKLLCLCAKCHGRYDNPRNEVEHQRRIHRILLARD